MSDDSDLMVAAAATAAVVTWMGMRSRGPSRGTAAGGPDWRALLHGARGDLARIWRETPGCLFVTGIRDAFFRKGRRSRFARRTRTEGQ